MELPAQLMPHTIVVEPVTGESAYGTVHGAGVDVRCNWQGDIRLVRAADGSEVVSSGTAYASLTQSIDIGPGARVTTPDGSTTYVIQAIRHDDAGLGAWRHLEIVCQ